MQRSFRLATREREPSLDHWAIAIHTTMALIVIVLVTLTFAALEQFAAGLGGCGWLRGLLDWWPSRLVATAAEDRLTIH